MRNLAAGCLLLLGISAPPSAWAENPAPAQPAPIITSSIDQLRGLFTSLNLHLIATADAAECKDEGELCKTTAECCPGLECSGDPQATCRPQE